MARVSQVTSRRNGASSDARELLLEKETSFADREGRLKERERELDYRRRFLTAAVLDEKPTYLHLFEGKRRESSRPQEWAVWK